MNKALALALAVPLLMVALLLAWLSSSEHDSTTPAPRPAIRAPRGDATDIGTEGAPRIEVEAGSEERGEPAPAGEPEERPGFVVIRLSILERGRDATLETRWRGRIVERRATEEAPGADARTWPWFPLLGSDPFRLQYPWRSHEPDARYLPFVEVESADGHWHGDAALGPLDEDVSPYVVVHVEPRLAALRGRVLGRDAAPMAGLSVLLDPEDAAADDLRQDHTDSEGRFAFDRLFPGSWKLRLRPRQGKEVRRALLLGTERLDLGDVFLEEIAGDVSGRITTADGARPWAIVTLRAADAPPRQLHLRPDDSVRSAQGSGRRPYTSFAFVDLLAGDYELELRTPGAPPGDVVLLSVRPPAEDLALELPARGEPETFELEVQSPAGFLPNHPRLEVTTAEAVLFSGEMRLGRAEFDVPRGLDFRWGVLLEEHASASGARADFDATGRLERLLEPGWGAGLRFVDAADPGLGAAKSLLAGRALDGVRVLADGRPVATSGADGTAWLALSQSPAELAIEYPGWRLEPGSLVLLESRPDAPFQILSLRRE